MKRSCPLNKCRRGCHATITDLRLNRRMAHRFCEMGMGRGKIIKIIESNDDVIICCNGTRLTLDRNLACDIMVDTSPEEDDS